MSSWLQQAGLTQQYIYSPLAAQMCVYDNIKPMNTFTQMIYHPWKDSIGEEPGVLTLFLLY